MTARRSFSHAIAEGDGISFIVEVNDAVIDDPELLNEDPQGEGWLVKLRFSSADDLKSLMTSEQYEEFVKSGE